jgi:ethanolamine permease
MSNANASTAGAVHKVSLLRILGPSHVWALGVGIVLVGEYTGWNFAADKGGTLAALIICWVIGLLYTSVAMIDSEVTSTVAAAGGQYAQAKHIVGPLMAFNVALYLVFAYTMLEVSNAILIADTIKAYAGEGFGDWHYTLTHEKAEKISCLETGVGFDLQYDSCWLSLT